MPITFSCPSCSAKMTVPDALAGKRGKCSKCKGAIVVPAPETNGAAKAPPRGAAALPPPVDLEVEALAALSDFPTEAEKQPDFIEFKCPQCDEPLKLPLDLAGKRHPCPECRRIIPVPMPKVKDAADWRNTGPKLPAGARRDDGPAPEGAWGTGVGGVTRASTEALQEAGVIKEKERPLTLYQRFQTHLLVGVPALMLLAGGLFAWGWMARKQEKRALDFAMTAAAAKDAPNVLGADGLMALHGYAGEYFLNTQKQDCATLARDQYGTVVVLARSARSAASDALLGELALAELALAGGPEETDTKRKLNWKETHHLVSKTLERISSPEGRRDALRRVTAALVEHGETGRVLPLVAVVSSAPGDRSEALATVGLELLRLGKKEEADKALAEALKPFNVDKTDKKDKKAKPPALTVAVVSLAKLQGKETPRPEKSLEDEAAQAIGFADALARQGQLDAARGAIRDLPVADGSKLRGLIAVAVAAPETKNGADDIQTALDAVPPRARHELAWPLLRLIEVGLAAGLAPDKLEPAAAAIPDSELAAWGRLLVLRARLAKSSSVESDDLAEKISKTAESVGRLVAHLELARHNARRGSGWASQVKSWDEAARALGSLGVALGKQGAR